MSNMGYLSTLLTPEARDKAGPKNGAVSMVTVNIDPLGAVSVTADVTVQGQGHETVLSQIVADQLGPAARRRRRDAGDGHRQGPVVDRRRHLFVPLHARHRGGGADGGGAHGRQAQGHRAPSSSTCCPTTSNWPAARSGAAAIPTTRMPFGRVAGTSHWSPVMLPEGMAAGAERDRGVDAARTGAAVERRPHQHLADLRLRVRHVRHRDRSGHLPGAGRPLRLDARRRHDAQSADRRRPDARRLRAGHRGGALRGIRHQRGGRVPHRHVRRLSGADGERNPGRSRCCTSKRRRRSRRSAPRAWPKATA